jgi:deoxyribodipyrimidine photo-lyase
MSTAIHWFRRDLRLTDNTALNAAAASHQRVIPAYILSAWKTHHRWTGAHRQKFLCDAIASLDNSLRRAGSSLVLRQGDAVENLVQLLKETNATAVYTNRDPDPYGRETERRLAIALEKLGARLHLYKDASLHERDEVLTGSKTPFRVFTPYSRAWGALEKPMPGGRVHELSPVPSTIKSLPPPTLDFWKITLDSGAVLPEAGEAQAQSRLVKFLDNLIFNYANARDIPSLDGTSRISQDLRFGILSIREVFARVQERLKGATSEQRRSAQIFVNELCWREFYHQVLWFKPEVLLHEYSEAYRGLPWLQDPNSFSKWCEGQTGFPIVDAGMRQLRKTGFMHNRVRMIVAMFLTKDLHLDWRMGEQWFMQQLLDGEIAANNGGWQWSAGTGTDAAPYFRIQNPWTQSSRFDGEGEYIKRWVPELAGVPAARLHQPPAPGMRMVPGYPLPMLDHAKERDIALETYKAHLKK